MLGEVVVGVVSGISDAEHRDALRLACTALPDDELPAGMVRSIGPCFGVAAALVVAIGLLRPAPVVMVSAISAVLLLAWLALFAVFLALGGDPEVTDDELGHDGGHRAIGQ